MFPNGFMNVLSYFVWESVCVCVSGIVVQGYVCLTSAQSISNVYLPANDILCLFFCYYCWLLFLSLLLLLRFLTMNCLLFFFNLPFDLIIRLVVNYDAFIISNGFVLCCVSGTSGWGVGLSVSKLLVLKIKCLFFAIMLSYLLDIKCLQDEGQFNGKLS